MRAAVVCIHLSVCMAACGGGDGPTTQPSGTAVTGITVTLRDYVLVGTTSAATATATMSNGATQAVTSGWRSDAPTVATVTDSGAVSGVANGEATIIAASGGREGTKRIRVAPNYDGRWDGQQVITGCSATGELAGSCDGEGNIIGVSFPVGLTARHPGELSVSGEFSIVPFDEPLTFPTFTSQVEGDGAIRFSSTTVVDGIRAEVSWQLNSSANSRATGTIREKYSAPGAIAGELTYDSTVSDLARGMAAAAAGGMSRSRLSAIKNRLRSRLHR